MSCCLQPRTDVLKIGFEPVDAGAPFSISQVTRLELPVFPEQNLLSVGPVDLASIQLEEAGGHIPAVQPHFRVSWRDED